MPQRIAPAKINMGLHVLRKRNDGYHDIETVFLRIPWGDVLQAETGEGIHLTCSDPAIPLDESNLVLKAAWALSERCSGPEGAALHLEKHLPAGAGLGGGSSDAASTLLLLSELWGIDGDLSGLAAQVGSDVPFFLGPEAAFGRGRGEILDPLIDAETRETYRPPYPLVVAVPPVSVSTALAYSLIKPNERGRPDLRSIVLSSDLGRWRRELVNDFEDPVIARFPAIGEVKHALEKAGAGYAAMSGSGSAVFGFFEDDLAATGAAEALRAAGHRVWHGQC